MDEKKDVCQHCGHDMARQTEGQLYYLECTHKADDVKEDGTKDPACGMRTMGVKASPDYGAWEKVSAANARSVNGGKGSKSDPYDVPQATYFQEKYYLEKGKLYLCFKEYTGPQTPSQMVNNYFALVEG